ncbi:neuromedin-S [Pseudoliparis swirei]|uniref:neuromedin-S n=1 Tax=Pseudoliparis swirei TaxID=2059687 RepID=UPI0024BE208B|nr:neuromedin-S [Pseudoliparis swirei]
MCLQIQNVFKRFLFHYSRARPAAGAAQLQAHSVHPLMRLSPKLSPRRKKLLLLRARGLPEGALEKRNQPQETASSGERHHQDRMDTYTHNKYI